MNFKIKAEHYQVFHQDMVHGSHTMACDFDDLTTDEAEEKYTVGFCFSYTGVIQTTKDGSLGGIEIILPALREDPPDFYRKPVALDAEIKEFMVRNDSDTRALCCFVDEGTIFWLQNAGPFAKAVDCGDIVFYLDEEAVMTGFLVKIKEWNEG